jgi:NitT/TauT family transport system permease protein
MAASPFRARDPGGGTSPGSAVLVTGREVSQGSRLRRILTEAGWWAASIGLFVGIWELAWAVGWADPRVLPPPHLFLGDLPAQAQYFDTSQVMAGVEARGVGLGVLHSIGATILRVLAGLALGFVLAVLVGVGIRYFGLFGRLVLPTVTLLAPVSPLAWLPVAIYTFGTGNGPAVFLVFIAVFFVIVLATISEIDGVSPTYLNVARIMGADRAQIYLFVIMPAILPGLFMILRMNLFAAWMIVLIAESVGVGSGLGQVIMIARNTSNATLVFFTIGIIGIVGFIFDTLLRQVQKRMLYWLPDAPGALGR